MSKKNQLQLIEMEGIHKIECWIGLFGGLAVLLITLLFDPPGEMKVSAWRCLGMGTLMAAWWATEAIPIPATALLPMVLIQQFNVPFYFGGTSLLIVVGVAMDFMSQIESYLISRQYEGLMQKGRIKGRQ